MTMTMLMMMFILLSLLISLRLIILIFISSIVIVVVMFCFFFWGGLVFVAQNRGLPEVLEKALQLLRPLRRRSPHGRRSLT